MTISRILLLYHANDTMSVESLWGFKQNGCQVFEEKIETDSTGGLKLNPVEILKHAILHKTELVFLLNVFGLDKDVLLMKAFSMLQIHTANWFIDNPFYFYDYFQGLKTTKNHICFEWDRFYLPFMKQEGFLKLVYLPQATNPERFRPLVLKDEWEKKEFSHALTFAGNLDFKMLDQLLRNWLQQNPDYAQIIPQLLPEIEKECLIHKDLPSWTVIHSVAERFKIQLHRGQIYELSRIAEYHLSIVLRTEMAKFLAPYHLSIWGEKADWQSVSENLNLLGRVSYFKNMPYVFNGSEINLNISRIQQRFGTNQRVFDVPACKAFVLTDYKQELEDLFHIGKEIDVFRDFNDLSKKINFYGDFEKRKRIAIKGYERVLSCHTYSHRMRQVLEVSESYPVENESLMDKSMIKPLEWIIEALIELKRIKDALEWIKIFGKYHFNHLHRVQYFMDKINKMS